VTRSPSYEAFFVPPEVDSDRAIALALKWLVDQPGEPVVLFHAKKMVDNNRLLGRAIHQYGLRYEAPRTIWNSGWDGGAILAPWASDAVIRCIDDDLGGLARAVCIIGWIPGDPKHVAWVRARNALDLTSGESLGKHPEAIIKDPVVRLALDYAEGFVNHNNALVQDEDKAYLVRTLEELVRGGHVFDLDELAAYAMATGWTGEEVKRIKEYGRRILDGGSFRFRTSIGPKPGACKQWEAEIEEES
jgi:hypothetical protein